MTHSDYVNKIHSVLDTAKANNHIDAMDDFYCLVAKMMEYIDHSGNHEAKSMIKEELCAIANGDHFNEDMAHHAISIMKKGGRKGEMIPFTAAISAAHNKGVRFSDFNEWDWYVALNMMYIYHYDKNMRIVNSNNNCSLEHLMIEDAKCFLETSNVYKHYKHTLKCKI